MDNVNINRHSQEPVAYEALNPLEWSEIALKSKNETETMSKLFETLTAYGFENGAYIFQATPETVQSSLGTEYRYFGEIISPEWEQFMIENPELASSDPVGHRLASGNNCIVLLPSIGAMPTLSAPEQNIFDMYQDFGFTAGVAFSSHDRKNRNFAALLLHHKGTPDAFVNACNIKNLRSIHLVTAYISEVFRIKDMAHSGEMPSLTDRENECLTWSAIGCTTKEIADILCLADATVNEYFSSAMCKLGAGTRTQACARAFLLNQISP